MAVEVKVVVAMEGHDSGMVIECWRGLMIVWGGWRGGEGD